MQTKNTRQKAKSLEFYGIIRLSPNIRLEKFLMSFLSDQAYFASLHQCCRYIRPAAKHVQQKSENAYNYYVKLHLGIVGVYSAVLFNI